VLPADVLLLCGIFGNVSDGDIRRTVQAVPALCRAGATVIWARPRPCGRTARRPTVHLYRHMTHPLRQKQMWAHDPAAWSTDEASIPSFIVIETRKARDRVT
jgi:hypothetical protein